MRIVVIALGLLVGAFVVPSVQAAGDGPPSLHDRPLVGEPVRFTDAAGHVFRPERLVLLGPTGARAARLPKTTNRARSEEHLDLSGLPLIGHVFQDRLAPGDAKRQGTPIGRLFRVGDTLVLDARESSVTIEPRDVVLSANFPRDGAVSYWLRGLVFVAATAPRETGRAAGNAWLVGDALVLAGASYGPAIEDLEGAIGGLLR